MPPIPESMYPPNKTRMNRCEMMPTENKSWQVNTKKYESLPKKMACMKSSTDFLDGSQPDMRLRIDHRTPKSFRIAS